MFINSNKVVTASNNMLCDNVDK